MKMTTSRLAKSGRILSGGYDIEVEESKLVLVPETESDDGCVVLCQHPHGMWEQLWVEWSDLEAARAYVHKDDETFQRAAQECMEQAT